MANLSDGTWLNEPKLWCAREDELDVTTDAASDFWQETHYGFTRDSGHFLAFATRAEFSAQLRIQANYEHLYDQAGIMVRLDAQHWLKAGVELSDGRAMLSSVHTNERSDWATGPFGVSPERAAGQRSSRSHLGSSADRFHPPLKKPNLRWLFAAWRALVTIANWP